MRLKAIYLLAILCIQTTISFGQQNDTDDQQHLIIDSIRINTDVFVSEGVGSLGLSFDLRKFMNDKYTDDYQKAILSFEIPEVASVFTKEVRIKPRGNNRKENCFFPPIRLNIKKTDVENKYLKETKKIKLITHCKNTNQYETYILKEYLVYKMYNLISPNSFRTRLFKIHYKDTKGRVKDIDSWSFLIEPEGILDERLDGRKIKNDGFNHTWSRKIW